MGRRTAVTPQVNTQTQKYAAKHTQAYPPSGGGSGTSLSEVGMLSSLSFGVLLALCILDEYVVI